MNSRLIILFILLPLFSNCAQLFYDIKNFDVYETQHFTFFYIPGSKCANDIEKIAASSEFAIEWASIVMNKKLEVKIDAYLYDSGNDTSYHRILPQLASDSTFQFRDGFQIIYEDFKNEYNLYISTILHEAMHFIQPSVFNLKNYAVMEGHAFYIQLKYYFYVTYNNMNDEFVCMDISGLVQNGIQNDKDFPHKIFAMNGKDFQDINLEVMQRDVGQRYEIGASFIAFLAKEYGQDKLISWFDNLDSTNYVKKFKEIYKIDFLTVESVWLQKYVY